MSFKAVSLISLGFTLVFVGVVWMIFDGIITNRIIPKYWIENIYFRTMWFEWNGIPTILLVVGIIVLIIGGSSKNSGGGY